MALLPFRIHWPERLRSRRALIGGLVAGLTCVLLVASSSLFAPAEESDQQAARGAADDAVQASAVPEPEFGGSGPTYPYSVVPGGVHSIQALTVAVHDPVVAEHYASIDIAHVHVDRVPAVRRAYVSYRIGDRLFWTRHTVALHPGEVILTDGEHQIRARCGNRISDTPQEPTQVTEPAVAEFDRALAPTPDKVPTLLDPPALIAGVPFAAANGAIGDTPPLNGLAAAVSGMGLGGTPGSESFPQEGPPGPLGTAGLGANPVVPDKPLVTNLETGPPPDEPIVPPGTPPEITPVPEPGSILLVGSGIAGCALRVWRRRRARNRAAAASVR